MTIATVGPPPTMMVVNKATQPSRNFLFTTVFYLVSHTRVFRSAGLFPAEKIIMTTNVNDNWYEDFFQGMNCEVWEKAVSHEWTLQEVNFAVRELKLQPGQHILDIPCGFGRHTIELAKRGFNVTGADISETFLAGLTKKIQAEN